MGTHLQSSLLFSTSSVVAAGGFALSATSTAASSFEIEQRVSDETGRDHFASTTDDLPSTTTDRPIERNPAIVFAVADEAEISVGLARSATWKLPSQPIETSGAQHAAFASARAYLAPQESPFAEAIAGGRNQSPRGHSRLRRAVRLEMRPSGDAPPTPRQISQILSDYVKAAAAHYKLLEKNAPFNAEESLLNQIACELMSALKKQLLERLFNSHSGATALSCLLATLKDHPDKEMRLAVLHIFGSCFGSNSLDSLGDNALSAILAVVLDASFHDPDDHTRGCAAQELQHLLSFNSLPAADRTHTVSVLLTSLPTQSDRHLRKKFLEALAAAFRFVEPHDRKTILRALIAFSAAQCLQTIFRHVEPQDRPDIITALFHSLLHRGLSGDQSQTVFFDLVLRIKQEERPALFEHVAEMILGLLLHPQDEELCFERQPLEDAALASAFGRRLCALEGERIRRIFAPLLECPDEQDPSDSDRTKFGFLLRSISAAGKEANNFFETLATAFSASDYRSIISRLTRFYEGKGKAAFFAKAYAIVDPQLTLDRVARLHEEFQNVAGAEGDGDLAQAFEQSAAYLRIGRLGDVDTYERQREEKVRLFEALVSKKKGDLAARLLKDAMKGGSSFEERAEKSLPSALYDIGLAFKGETIELGEGYAYVPIDRLVFRSAHYCVSKSKVEGYEKELLNGAAFPPIAVIAQEDGTYWIDEGHHRAAAAYLSGAEHMKVKILQEKTAYNADHLSSPFQDGLDIPLKFILLSDEDWTKEVG